MHSYLCPPKVDLRAFLVTQGVIPLHMQYEGSYWSASDPPVRRTDEQKEGRARSSLSSHESKRVGESLILLRGPESRL
jgi:hypothetical protein